MPLSSFVYVYTNQSIKFNQFLPKKKTKKRKKKEKEKEKEMNVVLYKQN